ncbi:MAG: hypothetical protein ACLP1X_18600 [Polyangiaceae bacterium]
MSGRIVEIFFGVRAEIPAVVSCLDRLAEWIESYAGWVGSDPQIVAAVDRLLYAVRSAQRRARRAA